MKQAIEKAIIKAREVGYEPKGLTLPDSWVSQIYLDPEFWRALGKATGNEKNMIAMQVFGELGDGRIGFTIQSNPYWFFIWRRFIDHLAQGKDVDLFFNELLK